jgi:beta-galactosidase
MMHCHRLLFGVLIFAGLAASASAQIASLPATLSLKTVDGVIVPFQGGQPLPGIEKQRRPMIDLQGIWMKQRFSADHVITMGKRDSVGYAALVVEAAGRHLPSFDDAAWTPKNLPGVENTLNGLDKRPEDYENGVWCRRKFSVPDSLTTRRAVLTFLAVNYVADVWLNGKYLGYHEGGYTPFSFDVTGIIRTDSANVLAVRVDNPPWGSRNDIVPYGTIGHKPDWFNFTGIIHDVYLDFPASFSIVRAEAIPISTSGTVDVTVSVWNRSGGSRNARIVVEACEAIVNQGNIQTEYPADLRASRVAVQTGSVITFPADSARVWKATLNIPSPRLWSPKHPDLYVLRAVLVDGTDTLGEYCSQFGIRTVGATGNTFLLNGKPMYFPGIARHEDHYLYGRSVPRATIYTDLEKVVETNATFLRTAHYPNHPYTYMIADRLGIAVMEEIPVWWFDESDAWLKQDFFRHIHEQMWREMVWRDRNRPSIIFWSTCNECLDQTNRGNFINRLNTELDAQYPDGRFVSESAAADRPGPTDPTQAYCDAAGWTMYFGIFHGSTYYAGTKDFLQKAVVKYPTKPFVDTEFGYWSTEDLGTAARQVTVFDSTFKAFSDFLTVDSTGVYHEGRPLCATTWWCIFDWYSIQTGNQTMGLYKMDHATAKPVLARLRDVYRPFRTSSENAVLSVDGEESTLPTKTALDQNYPNPFNPSSDIRYQISDIRYVHLAVYDLLGREVAVLVNEEQQPGRYQIRFNAAGLPSGVYFYRLQAGPFVEARKMLLLK